MTQPANFAEARLKAAQLMPYMSRHIMSLVPVEVKGLGTFACDKYFRIYYDPELLNEWTWDECATAILHEDLHLYLRCHTRAEARFGKEMTPQQQRMWNIAQDMVINHSLREANCSTRDDWFYPSTFGFAENLSTDEYYSLLREMQEELEQKGLLPKDGDGCDGEGADISKGNCGSCADGKKRKYEHGKPDGDNSPGLDELEQEMVNRTTAKKILDDKEKGVGNMPGSLVRESQEILKPKVDPVKELLSQVKYAVNATTGHGDYTWKKLPRRMPPGGVRLPAHIQPVPKVCVIVDTSGSMNDDELGLALGIIGNVTKAMPMENVRVISGDTQIAKAQKVWRAEQVELCGGGGTDMGALIVEAAKEKPSPDVIFVVTDGYTPWPKEPVRGRVVACVTRDDCLEQIPAWITAVSIEAA